MINIKWSHEKHNYLLRKNVQDVPSKQKYTKNLQETRTEPLQWFHGCLTKMKSSGLAKLQHSSLVELEKGARGKSFP